MELKNHFFEFTDKNYPLMEFKLTGNNPAAHDVDKFIECQSFCISQNDQVIVVFKASKMKYLPAEARIKLGNWNKANKELLKKRIKSCAFVTDSFFGKMMLKAIFLIQEPPFDYSVLYTDDQLKEWLTEQKL